MLHGDQMNGLISVDRTRWLNWLRLFWFSTLLSVSFILPVATAAQVSTNNNLTPREIAKRSLPSVVLLIMGNSRDETGRTGSGFFVAEDIIATNYHVIKDTNEGAIKIVGENKLYDISSVVGIDEKNDLALLRITGIRGKPLPLNPDDSIAIGDSVYAVGNPQGLEGTFSQGIVSSIRKSSKRDLIQITAPISEGSSGGAVLNDKGEVIGVAVGAIESGQALNFAIPVAALRMLIRSPKSTSTLAGLFKGSREIAKNPSQPTSRINLPDRIEPPKSPLTSLRPPDLATRKLFGAIKSIREEIYTPQLRFGEWKVETPVVVQTSFYDRRGYETSTETTFFEFSLSGYIWGDPLPFANESDERYPVTKHTDTSYDFVKNTVIEKARFVCSQCDDPIPESSILIKYSDNERNEFDGLGKLVTKQITKTEPGGRQIFAIYDADGNPKSRSVDYKSGLGKTHEYWTWSAESRRLILESKSVSTSREIAAGIETQTVEYNKDGKEKGRRKTLESKNQGLFLRWESTSTLKDGQESRYITKHDYEFDSYGNWIRVTEYKEVEKFGKTYFEPSGVTIRKITYY